MIILNTKQLEEVIDAQLDNCRNVLLQKGNEYAPASQEDNDEDRLKHFEKAASIMNTTRKRALFNLMSKHLISISDLTAEEDTEYPISLWEEKITDTINYLLLLKAIVIEDNEKTKKISRENIW